MTATHTITRPESVQRAGRSASRPVSGTAWVRACRVDDLEPSWGEAVLLRTRQIAVFRLSAGEVYAVSHEDPAVGAPVMARGIVGSRGDRPTIASPLHKEVYDLGTGECLSDPSLALETYPVRVVGGFVEIELGEERAGRSAA